MHTNLSIIAHRAWGRTALLLATLSTATLLAGGATPAQAASPVSVTTSASPGTTVGYQVRATANIRYTVATPAGTMTFRLFGPHDPACSSAIFTAAMPVTGTSVVSSSFVTSETGTYRWTSTYSGDANHYATGPTPCSWDAADVLVGQARVTLKATAQPPASGTLVGTATLSGGYTPTGTVTFLLTGPNDTFCSTSPVFTATVAVSGAGVYNSPGFVVSAAGTYRWRVIYGGDARNLGTSTGCIQPTNSVVV